MAAPSLSVREYRPTTAFVNRHALVYPDGTTYEGLMKRDQCELRGVMVYGDTGERYDSKSSVAGVLVL